MNAVHQDRLVTQVEKEQSSAGDTAWELDALSEWWDLRLVPLKTGIMLSDGWVNATLCLVETFVFVLEEKMEWRMYYDIRKSKRWARMEICNSLMPGSKILPTLEESKLGGGKIPLPLPEPKGADILSSHSLAARAHEKAQPTGHFY